MYFDLIRRLVCIAVGSLALTSPKLAFAQSGDGLPTGACYTRERVLQIAAAPGVQHRVLVDAMYIRGQPTDPFLMTDGSRHSKIDTLGDAVATYTHNVNNPRAITDALVAGGMERQEAVTATENAARFLFLSLKYNGVFMYKAVVVSGIAPQPVILVSKLFDQGQEVQEYCVADLNRTVRAQMLEWNGLPPD